MKLNPQFAVLVVVAFNLFGTQSFAHHPDHSKSYPAPSHPTPKYPSDPSAPSNEPPCLDDNNQELAADDAKIIELKTSTANQYLTRAHITGVVGNIYPDETGHTHFQAVMGPNPGDTIEVIYNDSFGALPRIVPGMTVDACGDFINSFAATSRYQASPDNAIIHWIHRNPRGGHPSGFIMLNGVVYGQGQGDGGA